MKRQWKVFFALFFVVCFSFVNSTGALAASGRDASEGVVLITQYLKDGTFGGTGTGFAIGEENKPVQYIVTNYHVIQGAYETNGVVNVYFSMAANRFVMAEVYWKSESKDLAVLKLPEPTTERKALVLCPSDQIDIDDTFTALGYPAGSSMNDFTKYDTTDIVITKGGISKTSRINETDCYLIDIEISEGNSGGPLVNSKGEVVGINSFYIASKASETAETAKFSYAITINELLRNIDRDVIPYTIAGEFNIVPIVIGVLIVAGGIVIFVVLKKKKKPSIHNKKTPENPAEKQHSAPEAPKQVLYGVSAPMGTFDIKGATLIGRDNGKCTIAFALDAPGISGVHCELTPFENGLILKDKNSSYGTYLADGTKLTPETPIKLAEGATFYLAEEKNQFKIIRRL